MRLQSGGPSPEVAWQFAVRLFWNSKMGPNDFMPGAVKRQKALPALPLTTQNVLKRTAPWCSAFLIHFVWSVVVEVMPSDILLHPKTFCEYYC